MSSPSKKPTVSSQEQKILNLLQSEATGAHGMAERVYAANFVTQAWMKIWDKVDQKDPYDQVAKIAEGLAGFANLLAETIRRLKGKR